MHSWFDRLVLADSLAQETARAVAIAPDGDAGLEMADALEKGVESRLRADLRGCPRSGDCVATIVKGEPARGEPLRVEVSMWVPGLVLPPFGEWPGFWLAAEHEEIVDRYRSLP